LPPHLRALSQQFADFADALGEALPDNIHKQNAFECLLEAKRCAVQALLYVPNQIGLPDPPPLPESMTRAGYK
jgi:ferritin-like protein